MWPLQETAATASRRTKLKPKEEAAYFHPSLKIIKYINAFKGNTGPCLSIVLIRPFSWLTCPLIGRGVFSCRHFQKGDFLVEYRGEVLNKQEYERRHRVYHRALEVFFFELRYNMVSILQYLIYDVLENVQSCRSTRDTKSAFSDSIPVAVMMN